jgi:uncharacterized repeat protein (TIGR03803 family)
LLALNGTFYGTTYEGGSYNKGTVFAISSSGTEHILHQFGARSDGANPQARLIVVNGVLYGTTFGGGANKRGTVFAIDTGGTETVLHSFNKALDGANPQAELLDVGGILYGTTNAGGAHGAGTVFSITTAGAERVLYSFGASRTDGANPQAGLIDVNGMLYGTTYAGGANGAGTVFGVSATGSESITYSFGQSMTDGANPQGGLLDVGGTLYGTTQGGGTNGLGTVFTTSTTGVESIVHNFGSGNDGQLPAAGLIALNGNLYGTTYEGGARNGGTVFAIGPNGNERVLYNFTGPAGEYPQAGLIAQSGWLYGMTFNGGGNIYYGAVFGLKL